jgi:hypothetical protein
MKNLMRLKTLLLLTLSILFLISLTGQAMAVTYTGSLSGGAGGGIIASDGWDNSGTILAWTVSDVGTLGGYVLWQYDYTFTGGSTKNISHMLIEVSPNSQTSDFTILSGSAPLTGGAAIYDHTGESNINLPSDMWSIKFGPENPPDNSLSVSFTTTRAPVWGDFYAKDGKSGGVWVTAWNAGFGSPDTDPAAGPSNGSLNNHILRPDTMTVVPEPVSSTLFVIGGAVLGFRRLRKMQKA